MKKRSVAVIIPTYNEKANIKLLIQALTKHQPTADIYVVDDQSPDGTAQVVKSLQKTNKKILLITNPTKGGRGKAVMAGFKQAYNKKKYDIFVEMDADFSHRPKEVGSLINQVNCNSAVIGSRYLAESRTVNWPLYRRVFSFITNKMLRLVLGFKLHDYTNGFRAYPKQAIRLLLKNDLITQSYFTLSETALILHQAGFTLMEVPTVFPNRVRGQSNSNLKELRNNLKDLLKIKWYYRQ